jgi:hypothetical protein
MLALQFGNTYKALSTPVEWLSDLCAFKAHSQDFEEKEDQLSV